MASTGQATHSYFASLSAFPSGNDPSYFLLTFWQAAQKWRMKADDYKIQNLLKEGQISLRAQNESGPVVVGWGMNDGQMLEGELLGW